VVFIQPHRDLSANFEAADAICYTGEKEYVKTEKVALVN
jgi:hypothetical protein